MNYDTRQINKYRRHTMRQVYTDSVRSKADYSLPVMERPDNNYTHSEGNAGCAKSKWAVYNNPLGSVYAPYQVWKNLYSEEKALSRGTMFEELDLPFEGANQQKGGKCLL